MATIADVAEYAGVSRSTVSHALSGNRPISLGTRERINEAIAALKFTPNAGAKALATARTWTIGLFVPLAPEEFALSTMQYVLVICETARRLGYDVLLVTEVEGAAGIKRVTDSNQVDGFILLEVKRHDERIQSVLAARQPGVLVGIAEGNDAIDSVDLDFAEAGRMLIRHLHAQGHRHVVFVTFPEGLFVQDLGYAWRLRESVLAESARIGVEVTVVTGETDQDARTRVITAALDEHPGATAFLVHNEVALIDLQQLLKQRELEVPRDISVVGVFPDHFGAMFSLPFTAVETSPNAVAARAVEFLAARILHPDREIVRELVAPTMVDRGSSREI